MRTLQGWAPKKIQQLVRVYVFFFFFFVLDKATQAKCLGGWIAGVKLLFRIFKNSH